MILGQLTITGADDNTDQHDLVKIQQDYPFVEWGILFGNRDGRPRFPTAKWVQNLCDKGLNLSCHLCSKWVDSFRVGNHLFANERSFEFGLFKRCQINTHAERFIPHPNFPFLLADNPKQYIIQMDGVNNELFEATDFFLREEDRDGARVVPLFDLSHGAGVSPEKWTDLEQETGCPYCGYAGGLGPENLEEQLKKLADTVGRATVWVDMETNVRNGRDLDLKKVVKCLKIGEYWNR